MNTTFRFAASLVLLAGIAGCEPLGDGSTIEKLELVVPISDLEHAVTVPATDTTPKYLKMYDCFCSNMAVLATFTNGTVSNFIYRVDFSSSDTSVVRVLNVREDVGERCALSQGVPGMLIPEGPGTAFITARFGELSDTFEVRVQQIPSDQPSIDSIFTLAPAEPATSGGVVVGGQLPMSLTATLDSRTRSIRSNVRAWTLTPEDEDVATVNVLGTVTGVAVDPAGTARTLSASFGDNCPIVLNTTVSVGDILGPLSLAREPGLVAGGDPLLAVNTDEVLGITAGLDFNNDGAEDATQVLSNQVSLGFEDDCTLRVYDANAGAATPAFCAETAGTCSNTTPLCPDATDTTCPSTLTTACRTEPASIIPAGSSRIIAIADGATPVRLNATYPRLVGDPTTLVADIDAAQTTLVVATLTRYPLDFPWYAVIDKAGSREDVKVTAGVTATDGSATLTVVRGISSGVPGSAAGAHTAGATFEQRSYGSTTPVEVQGHESTLTAVDVVDPATALPALGTLQVHAQGTFTDPLDATREQRVSRLTAFATGSPSVIWTSSDTGVAVVSSTGLVTSRTACGGDVTIRARASTSTNTDDDSFIADSTTDDDACLAGDALCDQTQLCVDGLTPLPDGTVCADGPHDCTP